MGYRSQVALKTTTEGYLVFKKLDKEFKAEEKALDGLTIEKTETGFYKISHDDIKWYTSYPQIQHFEDALDKLTELGIPFVFIRLGEDIEDIEVKRNWADEMPDELETFEPVVDINDDDWGHYEEVKEEEEKTPKEIMYELFDEYEEFEEIRDALRSLNSEGEITDEQYDACTDQWDSILAEWTEERR